MLKFLSVVLEQERAFRSVVARIREESEEEEEYTWSGGCREEARAARAVRAAVERGVLSDDGNGNRDGDGAECVECARLPPFEECRVRVAVPECVAALSAAQRNGWRWVYAYALLDQLWESHLKRCPDVKKDITLT